MAASKLTPSQWADVQTASEAGVDDETLANQYQITREALRKARSRGKWMTPERLVAEAERAKLEERHRHVATGALSRMSHTPSSGLEIAAKSLSEHAERYPLRVVEYLSQKIGEAVDGDMLPVINNWKSLSAADSMMRRNLGLDKPQTAISLNLWGSGSSGSFHAETAGTPFEDE